MSFPWRITLPIAALAIAVAAASGGGAAVELRVAGGPETIFAWRSDRCEAWDIPDAPARAFRDAGGQVHLIASHWRTRARVGPSLRDTAHDCRVVFEGAGNDDPAAWDDRLWLIATYTDDGRTVHALGHAEYHGHLRPAVCPAGTYKKCWWNAIVQIISTDGGRTFQRREGRSLVAALPYTYDAAHGRPAGFFNPSNIINHLGAHYALVFTSGYREQKPGVCLLRTTDIDDPAAWRAWDGTSFAVSMTGDGPDHQPCAPIAGLPSPVGSVSRIAGTDQFVAVFSARRSLSPGAEPTSGIYAASSADLIHWSAPQLLLATPLMWAYGCADPTVLAYPALLDETAGGRNFDAVGDRPYLYVTRLNPDGCRLTTDRDLVRYPVTISASAPVDQPRR